MSIPPFQMRLLEVRSGIFFEYPKLQLTDKNLLFFLPFWENPIITENKAARLVEYNLINRGSALFSHTGAEARTISIDFTLTIPHIMKSINTVTNSKMLLKSLNTESEKKRFDNINPFTESQEEEESSKVLNWRNIDLFRPRFEQLPAGQANLGPGSLYHAYITGDVEETDRLLAEITAPEKNRDIQILERARLLEESGDTTLDRPKPGTRPSKKLLKGIETVTYILNTIRSCVAGNATNTVLGPPVLRLRHGASYNDVPLICRSYNIEVDQDAGYDLKTLLPHRTTITLDCAELRTGDFETFKPGEPVARDTLAGWEAVHQYGSTDPGRLK